MNEIFGPASKGRSQALSERLNLHEQDQRDVREQLVRVWDSINEIEEKLAELFADVKLCQVHISKIQLDK